MKYPAELYQPSPRPYRGLDASWSIPSTIAPSPSPAAAASASARARSISVTVFAGQNVGIREVDEHIWLVSFMHYDLGFFDHESRRVECAPNPFAAKVLPMSPE